MLQYPWMYGVVKLLNLQNKFISFMPLRYFSIIFSLLFSPIDRLCFCCCVSKCIFLSCQICSLFLTLPYCSARWKAHSSVLLVSGEKEWARRNLFTLCFHYFSARWNMVTFFFYYFFPNKIFSLFFFTIFLPREKSSLFFFTIFDPGLTSKIVKKVYPLEENATFE